MSAVETLRKARELLTPEGAWGQGRDAENAAGLPCSPGDEGAVCWCSYGAMNRAGQAEKARPFFMAATGADDYAGVVGWNDAPDRTHAEVLAAFDRAIELAEASAGGPQ